MVKSPIFFVSFSSLTCFSLALASVLRWKMSGGRRMLTGCGLVIPGILIYILGLILCGVLYISSELLPSSKAAGL